MQCLKAYAISFLAIALLAFPSTTLSQEQQKTSKKPKDPLASATKFVKAKGKIVPNRYIVVLNDDVVSSDAPLEVRHARVAAVANRHAETYDGKVKFIYETALKGYSIELPNEAAAVAISKLPEVRWVEEVALGELSLRRLCDGPR